jgi:quinol monooxygenase YgiN
MMNASFSTILLAALSVFLFSVPYGKAQESQVIRLAILQIDSAQLESYKVALKEEIETSVRIEPGVLSLYAVSDKDNPTRITIFEIYANTDAYNAHRETPHFKKYKSFTRDMIKSLELIEVVPIILGAKTKY